MAMQPVQQHDVEQDDRACQAELAQSSPDCTAAAHTIPVDLRRTEAPNGGGYVSYCFSGNIAWRKLKDNAGGPRFSRPPTHGSLPQTLDACLTENCDLAHGKGVAIRRAEK